MSADCCQSKTYLSYNEMAGSTKSRPMSAPVTIIFPQNKDPYTHHSEMLT